MTASRVALLSAVWLITGVISSICMAFVPLEPRHYIAGAVSTPSPLFYFLPFVPLWIVGLLIWYSARKQDSRWQIRWLCMVLAVTAVSTVSLVVTLSILSEHVSILSDRAAMLFALELSLGVNLAIGVDAVLLLVWHAVSGQWRAGVWPTALIGTSVGCLAMLLVIGHPWLRLVDPWADPVETYLGEELPMPRKPLSYDTVLEKCAVALPPVRELPACPADAIGKTIDERELCEMLVALKKWVDSTLYSPPHMEAGDWARVRSVTVCRFREPTMPGDPPGSSRGWRLMLDADVPERPRLFIAEKSTSRPKIHLGVNHR